MSCHVTERGITVHAFSPEAWLREGGRHWVCDCGQMQIPRPQAEDVSQVDPALVWTSVGLLALVALGGVAWLVAWLWP